MASSVSFTREEVIIKAKEIIAKTGWESLNARGLAKELGVSTKPLYRMFKGMDEIKDEVYDNIYKFYDEFVTSRIDKDKALITLCVAYVEFAQEHNEGTYVLYLRDYYITMIDGVLYNTENFAEEKVYSYWYVK